MVTTTQASNLSYNAISRYAERVGEHYGIYDVGGKADIDRLVDVLGGRVVVHNSSESLHVRDEDDFVIYIPQTTSERRDRFTIAHELGHYFLHYLYLDHEGEETFSRGGRNRAETEANVFAAALLMPADHFTREYERIGNATLVAWHFDVSPAAADVRAQVLGLSR